VARPAAVMTRSQQLLSLERLTASPRHITGMGSLINRSHASSSSELPPNRHPSFRYPPSGSDASSPTRSPAAMSSSSSMPELVRASSRTRTASRKKRISTEATMQASIAQQALESRWKSKPTRLVGNTIVGDREVHAASGGAMAWLGATAKRSSSSKSALRNCADLREAMMAAGRRAPITSFLPVGAAVPMLPSFLVPPPAAAAPETSFVGIDDAADDGSDEYEPTTPRLRDASPTWWSLPEETASKADDFDERLSRHDDANAYGDS